MLFQWIFIHVRSSPMIRYNKSTLVRLQSALVSWFCVRPSLKDVVFENNPNDHETWSIWYHVGIHGDFTAIFHSLTSLVPQAQCEEDLDQLQLFHQWECLKCNGHGPLVLYVKWPYELWMHVVASQGTKIFGQIWEIRPFLQYLCRSLCVGYLLRLLCV